MIAPTQNQTQTLESMALPSLAERVDVHKFDQFLDRLFVLAGELGRIHCTWSNDTIRVQEQELKVPRARMILRMLCARPAARTSQWSGQDVSPYGDSVEFVFLPTKVALKVTFENTSSSQKITIEKGKGPGEITSEPIAKAPPVLLATAPVKANP
jgi:hypothetical protein